MGTRGCIGFYYEGKYYLVYIPFDAYLSGAGNDVINDILYLIKIYTIEEIKQKINLIDVEYNIREILSFLDSYSKEEILNFLEHPEKCDDEDLKDLIKYNSVEKLKNNLNKTLGTLDDQERTLFGLLKNGIIYDDCDQGILKYIDDLPNPLYIHIMNIDDNTYECYYNKTSIVKIKFENLKENLFESF